MFTDNTNKELWEHAVESTLYQDNTLPILYYRPFKFSRFYLKHHFPEWDLSMYYNRFYYAERYFNASTRDRYGQSNLTKTQFKGFLNQKILVYPCCYVTKHNLFNLDYLFEEH